MKRLIFIGIGCLIAITMQAQQLERAEFFFDTDPGFGKGISITLEGEQDSVNTSVDISHLSPGIHVLYVRARDTNGCWGLHSRQAILVKKYQNNDLDRIFYSIDEGIDKSSSDSYPGVGLEQTIQDTIAVDKLGKGIHTLYCMATTANGITSQVAKRMFFVTEKKNTELDQIYYSIDEVIDANTSTLYQGEGHDHTIHDTLAVSHLGTGMHTLYFLATTACGEISQLAKRMFYIPNKPGLRSLEYYYTQESDTILGPVQRFVGIDGDEVTFESALSTDMLEDKHAYSLHIKGVDMHGYRSETVVHDFEIQRPSNIVEKEGISSIIVFPNPAKNMITFQTPDNTISVFQIYSTSGVLQKVINRYNESTQCSVEDLQPGVYILKAMSTTGGQCAQLFIKE